MHQETRHFTASELASMKQQVKASKAAAQEAAKKRAYKLHPRIAKARG